MQVLDRVGRAFAFGLAVWAGAASSAWAGGAVKRVSVGPSGLEGDEYSQEPSLSANGRFVAFESGAGNLVRGDTNGTADVFVRDRKERATRRVSVGLNGAEPDGNSYGPAISATGRFVAFASSAANLVPGDTNREPNVFLRDLGTGNIWRLSEGPGGIQGDSFSQTPAISAFGRFVAFVSLATNLVPNDTNNTQDVFVHDRRTGAIRRVSVATGGAQGDGSFNEAPAISADGRFVAFYSDSTNLVPNDTNGVADIFVHELPTGQTRRVSVGAGGEQSNGFSASPSLSADGRFVAFISIANNLVPGDTNGEFDVFVRDRRTGTTKRVSVGPDGTQGTGGTIEETAISADGRAVAFAWNGNNLVPNDTNGEPDVFVRDLSTGATSLVSAGRSGAPGNAPSFSPVISANGRVVGFASPAGDLVPGDTNGVNDVFVRAR
jgi:Tol biopolymer transport system component